LESQVKVALDTNMLLAAEQFKVRLIEEIESKLPKARIVIPNQVITELEKLAGRSKKLEKQVKIARQIIKNWEVKQVEVKASNADKALLTLAKQGFIIATNDRELRKKVKKVFGKCLILRKKKYLIME